MDSPRRQTFILAPGQPDERSAKRGAAHLRPLDRCAQMGARPAHVRQVYQTGYDLHPFVPKRRDLEAHPGTSPSQSGLGNHQAVLKWGNPIVQVLFSTWALDSTENLHHQPSNGTTNPETTPGEYIRATPWPSSGTTTPERPRAQPARAKPSSYRCTRQGAPHTRWDP